MKQLKGNGRLNGQAPLNFPKKDELVEPSSKLPTRLPPIEDLQIVGTGPTRYGYVIGNGLKRFFRWIFLVDTYKIEKITEPFLAGYNRKRDFLDAGGPDGGLIPIEKVEPVYIDRVIDTNSIPVTRLRLPFRMLGIGLLVGSLGWGLGYCTGFPPPQRVFIESQRNELYRYMEYEECCSLAYRESVIPHSFTLKMHQLRCAERIYTKAHEYGVE